MEEILLRFSSNLEMFNKNKIHTHLMSSQLLYQAVHIFSDTYTFFL